jgi:hypothetical protein
MAYLKINNGDRVSVSNHATNSDWAIADKRAMRNSLLAESDSYLVSDRGLSESKLTEWKTYRQSLRDMDFSDLNKIEFPTKPE